jgi:hypothetical protein
VSVGGEEEQGGPWLEELGGRAVAGWWRGSGTEDGPMHWEDCGLSVREGSPHRS